MLNSSKYFRKHAQIRDSFVVKFSSHRLKILVEFKRAHNAGISEFYLSTELGFSNKNKAVCRRISVDFHSWISPDRFRYKAS